MIKNILKIIMAVKDTIKTRKFRPSADEIQAGAQPMVAIEIIEALKAYKKQNPAKYEAKKEALFKRYGLTLDVEPQLEEVPDEADLELEELTKKAKKTK